MYGSRVWKRPCSRVSEEEKDSKGWMIRPSLVLTPPRTADSALVTTGGTSPLSVVVFI